MLFPVVLGRSVVFMNDVLSKFVGVVVITSVKFGKIVVLTAISRIFVATVELNAVTGVELTIGELMTVGPVINFVGPKSGNFVVPKSGIGITFPACFTICFSIAVFSTTEITTMKIIVQCVEKFGSGSEIWSF